MIRKMAASKQTNTEMEKDQHTELQKEDKLIIEEKNFDPFFVYIYQ